MKRITPTKRRFGFVSFESFVVTAWTVLRCLALTSLCLLTLSPQAGQPVLYSTDLFHPHDDPDDHFDLAVLHAIRGIELKGIVLDQGAIQRRQPGRIPVSQLDRLTGRRVPVAVGLPEKLESPEDKALDQDEDGQQGVRLILDTLESSPKPVALVTVGSVRDVVAAFHREPALCRRQIRRVLCFIGEASKAGFREHNVGLDPQAFIGLMRSGLPVYWVPCFDGGPWQNRGSASFWQASHAELLASAPPGLVQFFLYAIEKKTTDPLAFLAEPVDAASRARLFGMQRNLWCTAVFVTLADQGVAFDPEKGAQFVDLAPASTGPQPSGLLFAFEKVDVRISDEAVIQYGPAPDAKTIHRFKVLDPARYGQGMTAATAALLRQFPVRETQERKEEGSATEESVGCTTLSSSPALRVTSRIGWERAGVRVVCPVSCRPLSKPTADAEPAQTRQRQPAAPLHPRRRTVPAPAPSGLRACG